MDRDRTEWEQIGESVIRTELPLHFESLTGVRVPAKLTELRFRLGEAGPRCEIAFEVSADTAKTVQLQEWFHLFRGMASGTPAWEPEQPVRVRAALRAELAGDIASSGGDAETVMDALLAPAGGAAALPLRCSECWLALEMSQTLRLPEALQDSGSLKVGLRTAWLQGTAAADIAGAEAQAEQDAEGQPQSTGGEAKDAGLETQLRHFLLAQGLEFEALSDKLIRLRFRNDAAEWVSLLRIEDAEDACIVYSVFPTLVPEGRRSAIALALMSVNYDNVQGSFEMDHEDGELRFRTVMHAAGSNAAAGLGPMLAVHVETMSRYMPAIQEMLVGAE